MPDAGMPPLVCHHFRPLPVKNLSACI